MSYNNAREFEKQKQSILNNSRYTEYKWNEHSMNYENIKLNNSSYLAWSSGCMWDFCYSRDYITFINDIRITISIVFWLDEKEMEECGNDNLTLVNCKKQFTDKEPEVDRVFENNIVIKEIPKN